MSIMRYISYIRYSEMEIRDTGCFGAGKEISDSGAEDDLEDVLAGEAL